MLLLLFNSVYTNKPTAGLIGVLQKHWAMYISFTRVSCKFGAYFTYGFIFQDYVTAEYAKEKGLTIKNLSGTKFRQMLRAGDDIPTW